MVEPWIIEKIRRDEEQRRDDNRPRIQIPLYPPMPVDKPVEKKDNEERGVWIIQIA